MLPARPTPQARWTDVEAKEEEAQVRRHWCAALYPLVCRVCLHCDLCCNGGPTRQVGKSIYK